MGVLLLVQPARAGVGVLRARTIAEEEFVAAAGKRALPREPVQEAEPAGESGFAEVSAEVLRESELAQKEFLPPLAAAVSAPLDA